MYCRTTNCFRTVNIGGLLLGLDTWTLLINPNSRICGYQSLRANQYAAYQPSETSTDSFVNPEANVSGAPRAMTLSKACQNQ